MPRLAARYPRDAGQRVQLFRRQFQVLARRSLDADLHHEILILSFRGWLMIVPKGVFGVPLFYAANLFYNPLDRMDLRANPTRTASLARLLEQRLGWDRREILDYAFAHACLSASWHVEDGNTDEAERSLAVARAAQQVIREEF
jgi:streptomycin 6-kinase